MVFDPNAAAAADSGVFGLPDDPEHARVVLVPVPWDATTSYRAGAAQGPDTILEASKQVDLFDLETGKPYEAGITLTAAPPDVGAWNAKARAAAEPILAVGGDVGDNAELAEKLAFVNELGARVNERVAEATSLWLDEGRIVGIVGGDHATPFGAISAVAERHPGLGILHIDAHADLRHAYEGFTWSHASIMENVATRIDGVGKIVQVGIRDFCEEEFDFIAKSRGRVVTHFDADLADARRRAVLHRRFDEIARALPPKVYVSFDIDGLDPVLCPGTGTPVPGGLAFHEVGALLGAVVAAGKRIVAFDLNEVAPGDNPEWNGNVGARVLYKLIGFTLLSQGLGRRPGRPSAPRRPTPTRRPQRKSATKAAPPRRRQR